MAKVTQSLDFQTQHPILLFTVAEVEARAVFKVVKEKFGRNCDKPLFTDHKTYYDLGVIGGARTLMVRSEMGTSGPGGSTTTAFEVTEKLAPSAIIMVGIAFGVDPGKQSIGDILVSKQLLEYELQRVGTDRDGQPKIISRGDRPSASPRLLDRFRDGALGWEGPKVRFGLILSGQKLIDNIDFRDQLRTLEPEAIGGEMEGAGLYATAHLHKVDWILVKAICDWADGKKYENKSQRQAEAARNAARFTIHVIERGGLTTGRYEPLPVKTPEQLRRLAQRNLDNFSAKRGQINPQLHPRRVIQDELESFLLGKDKRCILLVGDGGTGKSSLLYHLAKWAVESEMPLLYLDAEQQQLQDANWLVATLGCKAEDLPNLPRHYEQQFGRAPFVLIDTVDQLVGPKGIDPNVSPYLLGWSGSTQMICASRSGQAGKLHELVPSATMKVIPKLTEAEIEIVVRKMGRRYIRDERLLEFISIPLFLYLWLETGARPLDTKGLGLTSLWSAYWNEVIRGKLAAPKDWENFTEAEFTLAKTGLLGWLAQRMFQQANYQVSYQQIASELLAKHIYGVAYDALIRAGTISTEGGSGATGVRFFHQRFFEFVVGRRILDLDRAEAKHAIDQLIMRVDEPFCRQIIDEFAYLTHQQKPDLEDYLYHGLIAQLGSAKMEMLKAQRENRPRPLSASAVSWGIDYVLQDLVDHWAARMCGTLDSGSGSPDCPEDGEVASTIASVFERHPRLFAVPSLVAGMHKYQKRARFIGALAKIGTEETKSALLKFTQEQIACPTDKFVFRFLAAALGEARVEEAAPLLQTIRDGDYDDAVKDCARRALQQLVQKEHPGYSLEYVLYALSPIDEEGRPSDWSGVCDVATWLRSCGSENKLVRANLAKIIPALQANLDHMQNGARKPVATALGELGNAQTFDLLSKRLTERLEPSQGVVMEILSALVRLAERGQAGPAMTVGVVKERFSHIRLQYPALAEKVRDVELKILEHLGRKSK
jgi:nucleoside phosphorylase